MLILGWSDNSTSSLSGLLRSKDPVIDVQAKYDYKSTLTIAHLPSDFDDKTNFNGEISNHP
jgi:hypothetical protein